MLESAKDKYQRAMNRNSISENHLNDYLHPLIVQVLAQLIYELNKHGDITCIMCILPSGPPADVNFWVNGDWQQSNCRITVNPLCLPAVSPLPNDDGVSCIA